MRKLIYNLLLFGLLSLSACAAVETAIDAASPSTAEDDLIVASGTIRASEIHIASEFGGRIASVDVSLGDDVRTGDVLIHLDSTPWELELGPKQSAILAAQAELDLLLAGTHPAEIEAAQGMLAMAKVHYDSAVRSWEYAQAVADDPQDIMAQIVSAQSQVELAAQGVELAESELHQARMTADMYEAGSLDRKTADANVRAAEESLAAAQADEQTAQILLSQLWGLYNNPLGYIAQANTLQSQVIVAQAGITVAQAQLEQTLAGPMPEEVAVKQAAVRVAQAEADALELKIDRSVLTSPVDAVVVSQSAYQGELVAPAGVILTLADINTVILDVYVSEGRIGRVALGQEVRVTVDSFPDQVFSGYVSKIADEAEFTPRNVATTEERMNTFYAVSIYLENPDHALKPGMPADAEFVD